MLRSFMNGDSVSSSATAEGDRNFELILFGATGFTGALAAEYLAKQHKKAPFRWAIAGRNLSKLETVKERLSLHAPAEALPELIQADSADSDSLNKMAGQARVLISTVGPYIRYGEPLVKACVEAGTDYVDITGEPEFVTNIEAKYHQQAEERGLRIVSCCGFDSIPHDFGVFYTLKHLEIDGPVKVEGFVRAKGTASGGTWNSAIDAFSRFSEFQKLRKSSSKTKNAERKVGSTGEKVHYQKQIGAWAAPMPTIDPQVVKRSARVLDSYGKEFRYGHYILVRKLSRLAAMGVGVGAVFGLAQLKPTRDLLRKYKPSGAGPDEATREKSWFKVKFIARSGHQQVMTAVSGGDPGYTETAKMLSESALCLALDRDSLPNYHGVVTPVVAMGDALLQRLQDAGIIFEVLSD